ncbi:ABC transporter substrate-binding protein [Arthrobacter bambusae]|jgi:glycine betaine/proline transport system substrate-binding protein|uniref:ABC transporter substrate-binding protein n=1 Tax=Arthrobacter TaxID=1663 RepID=UPI000990E702|nr:MULTISPECIES: ABC transporter substrate-binding protein [Arthrobacter]MCI0141484.1 ABC transporter substrate-binding protein [Arthrobacter bambusae]MDQ0211029.1 glycine betaine/proline transport system substrate-binding protein [Arthrobacter bambusae]MDQ0237529.1 glycine betaine/proline transport system substrate-binding protein [Arthrobacter bambusae]UYY82333.1 ABC transporter substrate-binding protein [Arthrobacter sp. YA7-1]
MSKAGLLLKRTIPTLAGTVAAALLLAGCGGATVNQAAAAGASGTPCGTVNVALNAWVGYTANAAVYSYIAQNKLGCTVVQKDLSEQISWQGFGSGEVDVILENWGHEDLAKQYITDQKVAVDAGPTGNEGHIGWYVPPWMVQKYPDILDSKNLNKYASLFATSESGGKGQVLDGDPAFVTNDEALVKNLGLDYKVVFSGSEAALIQSFRTAEKNKTPLLGYFYEPQWFLSEVPLKKVSLPAYTPGCDADAEKVACDYPDYKLNKVMAKKFADSGSPAAKLLKAFSWTNADQNSVATDIQGGMKPDAAAKKWVDAHPDVVAAWLK